MLVQAKLRPPPFLENTSKTLGEPFLAINTNIFLVIFPLALPFLKRKVMNLRSILNRLTEEELELLQEEIEGDLYDEIDKVLDDKNQPSLFGQNIHKGDVYTEIDAKGVKIIYLVVSDDNPHYCVNSFRSNGLEVVYAGSFWCKVSQMQNWEKRDECLWLAVQNAYDKLSAEKMRLNMEFARHFEALLDGSCEF